MRIRYGLPTSASEVSYAGIRQHLRSQTLKNEDKIRSTNINGCAIYIHMGGLLCETKKDYMSRPATDSKKQMR